MRKFLSRSTRSKLPHFNFFTNTPHFYFAQIPPSEVFYPQDNNASPFLIARIFIAIFFSYIL